MSLSNDRPALLVGRNREMRVLERNLEQVRAGSGRMVLIEGEAGIGKTSLALTFAAAAQANGVACAIGRCYERGVSAPFGPWHEVLDQLAADGRVQRARLPFPFSDRASPVNVTAPLQNVVDLIKVIAAERPLVLLIDDLHWADMDTLELLDLATRRIERVPVLYLLTVRREDVGRDRPIFEFLPHLLRDRPAQVVMMGPLGQVDVDEIAESRLGPCSAEFKRRLLSRSDGNPLFLHALLDDLLQQGESRGESDRSALALEHELMVPAELGDFIRLRIGRLGADAEAMLEVAAVVGVEWDLPAVEAALEWPEERLLAPLEAALSNKVVVPVNGRRERYRFAHVLFRDALYGTILERRRQRLHSRIAQALESAIPSNPPSLERAGAIAHHVTAAGNWRKSLRYCREAGDAARDGFAIHSSLAWYERALEAWSHLPSAESGSAAELHERIGQSLMMLRRQLDAERAFLVMREAAQSSGDTSAEGRALFWLSFVRTRLYQVGSARSIAEAALRVAEHANDERLLALAYWTIGHVDKIQGDIDSAERHMVRAESLARRSNDGNALSWTLQNRAQLAIIRGEYRTAETIAVEALDLAQASRDITGIGGICWVLGWSRGEIGRYDAARQSLDTGLAYATQLEDRHYLARLLNTLGWLHGEIGNWEAARRFDSEALEVARTDPHGGNRVAEAERYSLLNLATDELMLGQVDQATDLMREFEFLLDRSEYARFRYLNRYQLLRAEIALATGNSRSAEIWAGQARDLAQEKRSVKNLTKSRILGARARLANGAAEQAAVLLREAVELADRMEHGSLAWQSRFWLGTALAAQADQAAASRLFRDASEMVDSIARSIEDEQSRNRFIESTLVSTLRASGSPEILSRGAAGSLVRLTAREREVLRLVVQGETNARIARLLEISHRTVDVHLTNIYTKTGCENRASAVAYAVRHGLA